MSLFLNELNAFRNLVSNVASLEIEPSIGVLRNIGLARFRAVGDEEGRMDCPHCNGKGFLDPEPWAIEDKFNGRGKVCFCCHGRRKFLLPAELMYFVALAVCVEYCTLVGESKGAQRFLSWEMDYCKAHSSPFTDSVSVFLSVLFRRVNGEDVGFGNEVIDRQIGVLHEKCRELGITSPKSLLWILTGGDPAREAVLLECCGHEEIENLRRSFI